MDLANVFDCKMCGICCTGQGGIVVSANDLGRLANYLNLEPSEVIKRYLVSAGKKLKIRSAENGACIFFNGDQGCMVHSSKPAVCKAWPFFRGNLIDPISLAMAKDFCPGINPYVTHKDFNRVGRKYLQDENLVSRNTATEANALNICH